MLPISRCKHDAHLGVYDTNARFFFSPIHQTENMSGRQQAQVRQAQVQVLRKGQVQQQGQVRQQQPPPLVQLGKGPVVPQGGGGKRQTRASKRLKVLQQAPPPVVKGQQQQGQQRGGQQPARAGGAAVKGQQAAVKGQQGIDCATAITQLIGRMNTAAVDSEDNQDGLRAEMQQTLRNCPLTGYTAEWATGLGQISSDNLSVLLLKDPFSDIVQQDQIELGPNDRGIITWTIGNPSGNAWEDPNGYQRFIYILHILSERRHFPSPGNDAQRERLLTEHPLLTVVRKQATMVCNLMDQLGLPRYTSGRQRMKATEDALDSIVDEMMPANDAAKPDLKRKLFGEQDSWFYFPDPHHQNEVRFRNHL